jgi:MoxR-like ATPase
VIASPANPFIALRAGRDYRLDADDRFPAAGHLWSQPEIDALILAWAARRPLLVRGEAGSGKSQIARAAAKILGSSPLLVEVIHARFEALDLLYRVDHVERLADAQIPEQLDRTNAKYVKPGPLWRAMEPEAPAPGKDHAPPVLLIDEIDKADADVPNALLEVLGNRSFTVPQLQRPPVRAREGWHPLIVITTNEERELPPAFVRRCVVLNLNPPRNPDDPRDSAPFINWLIKRGRVHVHLKIADEVRHLAAMQVWDDREAAVTAGYPPVGLAEYIDLLTALDDLTKDESHQRSALQVEWIRRLSAYALVKNADQRQDRASRSLPAVAAEAGSETA